MKKTTDFLTFFRISFIYFYVTLSSEFSLRLYFNQGEFVLLRPLSGEREEMDEIISRLSAITQGSEVSHVTASIP